MGKGITETLIINWFYTVFSPVFRATGKSVFQTGKAARFKILFHPEVEVPS